MTSLTDALRAKLAFPKWETCDRDDSLRLIGEQDAHARLQPTLEALIECVSSAKELRIYCLGSDASTLNMIERFDQAITRLAECVKEGT